MESIYISLLFLIHVSCVIIASLSIKTKHECYWWMFFFTVPIGIIIVLLLDIAGYLKELNEKSDKAEILKWLDKR